MYFQYDTNGTPLGFIYNGTQYLYLTDQMGDVIAITDADGGIIAAYVYDAWGKLLNINYLDEENSEHNKIVNANPPFVIVAIITITKQAITISNPATMTHPFAGLLMLIVLK